MARGALHRPSFLRSNELHYRGGGCTTMERFSAISSPLQIHSTGQPGKDIPIPEEWRKRIEDAKIKPVNTPSRGDNGNPGTLIAGLAQQQYFLEMTLKGKRVDVTPCNLLGSAKSAFRVPSVHRHSNSSPLACRTLTRQDR